MKQNPIQRIRFTLSLCFGEFNQCKYLTVSGKKKRERESDGFESELPYNEKGTCSVSDSEELAVKIDEQDTVLL